MLIQPGTDIGRYHILEQLGQGGMAVVYKAYDTRLEGEVAVKVLRLEELAAKNVERTLKRFQIEAKKMAQLAHPNIVRVIDYGDFEGLPYLVMPYIPGGTLKNGVEKPMDWQKAAKLLKPLSAALSYAHGKKLIHRDVKPSNILITETGELLLTDFGVAKILDDEETLELTIAGIGVGTPEYMSPEQAEGKIIDERADIYSLGIVYYELVTGRKPFVADTPLAVIVKQYADPLPDPSIYIESLPDIVKHFLFKALAKEPNDRFQNMVEMSEAFEKLVQADRKTQIYNKHKQIQGKRFSDYSTSKILQNPGNKRAKWIRYSAILVSLSILIIIVAFGKNKLVDPINGLFKPTHQIYLAELEPDLVYMGFGELSIGQYEFGSSVDGINKGDKIAFDGKKYEHGIFAHAPSTLVYQLDGKYKRLDAVVGIASICKSDGAVFRVWGDGKDLIPGDSISLFSNSKNISVDITGINEMRLIFEPGPNMDCDWTIWGDPILSY